MKRLPFSTSCIDYLELGDIVYFFFTNDYHTLKKGFYSSAIKYSYAAFEAANAASQGLNTKMTQVIVTTKS